MRKFVSMFMALVMVFTMGPNVVVKAEDECFGEACRLGPDAPQVQGNASLTGWAWCKENLKDCIVYGTTWLGTEIQEEWSDTVRPWLSEKADEAVNFKKQVEDFYNYDLNEQPKWTFCMLLTTAGVGVLTLGAWMWNLFTCCGCGGKCPRCRIRIS